MGFTNVGGIEIDIGANLEPLRRDLRQAESELNRFGSTLSGGTGAHGGIGGLSTSLDDANRKAGTLFSTLRGGVGQFAMMGAAAGAAAAGIGLVVNKGLELADVGWQAERTRMALDNLLSAGGQRSADWIRQIKDATHNTVTEIEAATQALQLYQLGLANTAEGAGEFVRMASIVGATSPQLGDTAKAIEQIGLAIANQSYERLDALGLSASRVRARVAELREEGMSLEDAFRVAVLDDLSAAADKIGDEVLEVGANTAQLQSRLDDLRADVGWIIGQGFEWAAGKILDTAEAIGWVIDQFDKLSGYEAARQRGYTTPGDFARQTGGLRQMLELTSPYAAAYIYGDWSLLPDDPRVNVIGGVPQFLEGQALKDWLNRHKYGDEMAAIGPFAGNYSYLGPPTSGPNASREGYVSGHVIALQAQARRQEIRELEGEIARMEAFYERQLAAERDLRREARNRDLLARRHSTDQERMGQIDAAHAQAYYDLLQENTGKALDFLARGMNAAGAQLGAAVQASLDAVTMPQSLAELVGLDPGGLQTDIFDQVEDMLRQFEVADDVAGNLMEQLALKLGQTTPAMELFTGLLETQTQRLADGEINAKEYMDQLARIQMLDFSRVNDLFAPLLDAGKFETAIAQLERLASFTDPRYALLSAEYAMSGGDSRQRRGGADLGEGPGPYQPTGGGLFASIINSMQETEDQARLTFTENMPGYVVTFADGATGEIQTFVADSVAEIGKLESAIAALDGRVIDVSINIAAPQSVTIPIGGGPRNEEEKAREIAEKEQRARSQVSADLGNSLLILPPASQRRPQPRATGGAVGSGLFEVNENGVEAFESGGRTFLIVPQGVTGTVSPMRRVGGGGGGLVIQGDVHIHGVQDPHAIWDGLVAEAQRRNVTIGVRT